MQKFYEGCAVCAFRQEGCSERCFDCAKPDIKKEGWMHSLGFYFSRSREEHRNSKWSQGIIKAKKRFMPVISSFGKIAAYYMDKELAEMKPYLITNVPAYRTSQYVSDFETSAMQFLAHLVFANLEDRKWVDVKQLLIQTQKKAIKQHCCRTDAQRRRNIKGIYAVKEPGKVKGRNIILLDDVITSGATMRECAAALFEAGAKEVIGVVLAKTFRMVEVNLRIRADPH